MRSAIVVAGADASSRCANADGNTDDDATISVSRLGRGRSTERFELTRELVDVAEGAVDGGEADVGDLVELAQRRHHLLAEPARRDLLLAELLRAPLDVTGDLLDLHDRHRPLFTG